ncbi:MAG: M1 family aminopeptidase [Aridibacter sp.]
MRSNQNGIFMKNTSKFPLGLNLFPILVVLLVSCFQIEGQAINETGKINGDIAINFKEEKLSAKLKYDYIAVEESESVIKFYLADNFKVLNVKCRLCQSYNIDVQSKPESSLLINLRKPLNKGERLVISIDYEGSLKNIYKKEHEFLELGLDNFWFPIHKNIGGFSFLYRINVKTDEPDFGLASNGRVSRRGKNWLIESKVPDYDIDLVLSRDFRFSSYQKDGYNLQVVSKNLPEETPDTLLANLREILEFYNSSFGIGNPQREVTAVLRPFPEVAGQGGYFRKGYFILPKFDDPNAYFFSVAHELAHYWFIHADRQNAWLNESFAEYSAMLALRQKRGVQAFNEILEQKKKNSVNLPAIYGFDRNKNPQQSTKVLYIKGPVKLNELEVELGEQNFMNFLREAANAKVKETDELIKLLARVSNQKMAENFLQKLKK